MRAGLSTIQQTLTPEAATVLNHSIAEASRRNHGQTTPLHVAATLLDSPSGYLRKACIRSHPNSSHPLQCRALELCFSVALERLPTGQNVDGSSMEPPISNALMAALKRAQAHQRRGCPEQQQQPLLAVKVELEQLIISILDDPSVSRVMREASFSSPAVKATIEQSLNNSKVHHPQVNFGGIPSRLFSTPSQLAPPPRASSLLTSGNPTNMYLNPRLATAGQVGNPKADDVRKVFDIMSRRQRRNPILVGDSEPEAVVKEFLGNIENKDYQNDSNLKNVQVISIEKGILSDKNQIAAKIEELGDVIASKIRNSSVILDLGDLKWLVEKQDKQAMVSDTGMTAVLEMTKLLGRFGRECSVEGNKMWLIGTATCETYLRCQVYHSTMESDWDLQAVPVAPRSSPFPRLGNERIFNNPMESWNPLKTICPQCSENYDKELTKLAAINNSFSESKQQTSQSALPQWLQNAKLASPDPNTRNESPGLLLKQKTKELQKKWKETCLHLHPNFHQNTTGSPALSLSSLYNPNILTCPPFQPKLATKPLGEALQLNMSRATSPVTTDLALGTADFLSGISSEPQTKLLDKFSNALDADTYKKLLKGLMEKAWWQAEAASAVASAITQCRLGNGKRRGGRSRGDIWLLFAGPDRVGKKKMARVLAEEFCGASLVAICLVKRPDEQEPDAGLRGKTVLDRIAEVVRRNPFLVILLEDFDEADALVRGGIKRAIEQGRLSDSHGREIGLGNAVFIVTGDWSRTSPEAVQDRRFVDEKKLSSVAKGGWQLGLVVRERNRKRRANWLEDDGKEAGTHLSLDLNIAATYAKDEKTDGSSDLTIERDDDVGLVNMHFSLTSLPHELVSNVDDCIVFKPVNSAFVRREIKKTISAKFSMAVDENMSIEVEDDVVEKILGGLWHDGAGLGEWMDKVVGPSFDRLKDRLQPGEVVRLVVESVCNDGGKRESSGDWLPSTILV